VIEADGRAATPTAPNVGAAAPVAAAAAPTAPAAATATATAAAVLVALACALHPSLAPLLALLALLIPAYVGKPPKPALSAALHPPLHSSAATKAFPAVSTTHVQLQQQQQQQQQRALRPVLQAVWLLTAAWCAVVLPSGLAWATQLAARLPVQSHRWGSGLGRAG